MSIDESTAGKQTVIQNQQQRRGHARAQINDGCDKKAIYGRQTDKHQNNQSN